jgi:RimJ/RimL family protein N-acetyltransferase
MHVIKDGPGRPVKRFIEDHIPRFEGAKLPDMGTAIGVANERNELVGGFYFHDYDSHAGVVEVSMASTVKNWWTRKVLYELLSYAFIDLKCQMVGSRISTTDAALRRQLKAYGFNEYVIPRLFGEHHDAAICTLTIQDWYANRFTQSYLKSIGG